MHRPRPADHVPALDGVRGLAIALILIYHTILLTTRAADLDRDIATELALAGWVGVDLFFVLSGYLITGILLDTRGARGYFGSFYVRRTLRIFPLYYAVLTLVFIVAPLLYTKTPPQVEALWSQEVWYWTYLTNVSIALEGSWDATPLFTSHFWSLAVEEQFYLIWPALVLGLGRRRLLRFCLIGCALSPLLRMALLFLDVEPIALYVLTPTRLDPLLAGSALAALVRGGIDGVVLQRAALAGICGGAVMSAVVALLSGGFGELSPLVQIVGYSGVTGVGAGLLAMLVSPQPALALQRVFSLAPIRMLGRYSYGIYLFHFPIIMVVLVSQRTWLMDLLESAGRWPMALAVLVLSTACTSMLAVASYHLLEKRCLGLKRFFPHPTA